jgi:hypothetical protein
MAGCELDFNGEEEPMVKKRRLSCRTIEILCCSPGRGPRDGTRLRLAPQGVEVRCSSLKRTRFPVRRSTLDVIHESKLPGSCCDDSTRTFPTYRKSKPSPLPVAVFFPTHVPSSVFGGLGVRISRHQSGAIRDAYFLIWSNKPADLPRGRQFRAGDLATNDVQILES